MINKISIIFPIYNEEKRLSKSLIDIEDFIKLEKSLKTQIIFVNDGSKDRSLKLLLSFFLISIIVFLISKILK